jgi:HPt (histidine-containing phosphotransfer) domain-containing protein
MTHADIHSLREITGGAAALESELFQVFLHSSRECLATLRVARQTGDEETWKRQAHAFKGICFGLGAMQLGDLCKQAQDHHTASPADKLHLLTAIEEEFAQVERELKGL